MAADGVWWTPFDAVHGPFLVPPMDPACRLAADCHFLPAALGFLSDAMDAVVPWTLVLWMVLT